ncbi:MAG: PIN domain-containing protein [bacterium]|nr:PIN domain-containing protein [bacterium]
MVLVLDSGAISFLAGRSRRSSAMVAALQGEGLWPPIVPSPVLIECLQGDSGKDASTNRLLKSCEILEEVDERLARRAARLRAEARCGSAVDALVLAVAEPGGAVLTTDVGDLQALASGAFNVTVEAV